MPKHNLACLILILAVLPLCTADAQIGESEFGCPGRTQFFAHPDLQFVPIAQDAIEQWKTRPALAFRGFDEKKYGFQQIAIYRWRVPLQPRSNSDAEASAPGAQTVYRVELAIRLVGSHGDAWFELSVAGARGSAPGELLYMQAPDTGSDQALQAADALGQSFSIRRAAVDPALPLLLLEFSYNNDAADAVSNHLLLDVRSGRPQISKAFECIESESVSSICDVHTRPYENLRCAWEAAAGDFRCAMTSPFGAENAVRIARRDFYLFTAAPAPANWYRSQSARDLATLAVQLGRTEAGTGSVVMVPEFGPVTMLAHYKDLLPGTEQFVFASPGAGPRLNTHFSLVSVSSEGRASLQTIPKWVLSGEKADESARPRGYTPLPTYDRYRTEPLEDRGGFHSFQVALTTTSGAVYDEPPSGPTHVVYWVGLEAVDGKLVANAVRMASDGSITASCAQETHEGTAIAIEPQRGMAAATVHVQPSRSPDGPAEKPTEEADAASACVWIGGLYWKTATGFQVRKIDDDCEAGMPEVSISEEGQITVKPVQSPEQER